MTKRVGRSPTLKSTVVTVRLSQDLVSGLDNWARQKGHSRSDAIRLMIETGLSKATKASRLAGKQLDRLADPAAPASEQARRKRRLLKGPPEFRDITGQRKR
jgi:predicted DNA-binding protein